MLVCAAYISPLLHVAYSVIFIDVRLREQGQERAWDAILGRNQAPGTKPSDSEVEVDVGMVGARAIRKGGPRKLDLYFISLFELSRGQSTVLCSITLTILIIMFGIWPLPHSSY